MGGIAGDAKYRVSTLLYAVDPIPRVIDNYSSIFRIFALQLSWQFVVGSGHKAMQTANSKLQTEKHVS